MKEFFDIVSGWTPIGQGLFFFFVICCVLFTVRYALMIIAVLFRGWPPPELEEVEEE